MQAVLQANLIETRNWESLPYQPGLQLVTINAGAPVKAGDTLWLRSGYHGAVVIRSAYNAAPNLWAHLNDGADGERSVGCRLRAIVDVQLNGEIPDVAEGFVRDAAERQVGLAVECGWQPPQLLGLQGPTAISSGRRTGSVGSRGTGRHEALLLLLTATVQFVRTREVLRMLGVSRSTLWRMVIDSR